MALAGDAEALGSPPWAWGTLAHQHSGLRAVRLTPTGVGNTSTTWLTGWMPQAHPHGRGEHARVAPALFMHSGSPPRAWGARRRRS